jgi:glyoxylase I family protein
MYLHFEHVGMAVADLDASLRFYVDLIGMKLIVRKVAPNGTQAAFVDAGNGAMLEIMSPPGIRREPARRVGADEAGIKHITLAFENIDETYAKLVAAGVKSLEKPRDAYNRDILARVAFVEDPDGIIVELAQH